VKICCSVLNCVIRNTASVSVVYFAWKIDILKPLRCVATCKVYYRQKICFVGAASELGSALTRLCLRQRTLEDKLKTFAK
jgi:hypothetical protein